MHKKNKDKLDFRGEAIGQTDKRTSEKQINKQKITKYLVSMVEGVEGIIDKKGGEQGHHDQEQDRQQLEQRGIPVHLDIHHS